MAVVINTNISALKAQNSLRANNEKMAQAMERLSTGNRINGAKDDAAGMAIADRMLGKLNGFTVAIRNSNDAISMMQTAEGDMTQISINLQRIRELAIQSNNTTNSDTDRVSMQVETDQLVNEIQRIANASSFNGISLLNGDLKNASFQVGASNTENDRISVTINDVRTTTLGQTWRAAHWATPTTLAATSKVSTVALEEGKLAISIGSGDYIDIGASVDDARSDVNFITADSAAAKANAITTAIKTVDAFYDTSVSATTKVNSVDVSTSLNKNQAMELNLSTAYSLAPSTNDRLSYGQSVDGGGTDDIFNGTLTITSLAPSKAGGTGGTFDVAVLAIDQNDLTAGTITYSDASAAALKQALEAEIATITTAWGVAGAGSGGFPPPLTITATNTLATNVGANAYKQDTEVTALTVTFQKYNDTFKSGSPSGYSDPSTEYTATLTYTAGGSVEGFNTAMNAFAAQIEANAPGAANKVTASWDADGGHLIITDSEGEDIKVTSVSAQVGSDPAAFDLTNILKTYTGLEVGIYHGTVRIESTSGFTAAQDTNDFGFTGSSDTLARLSINGANFEVDGNAEYYQRGLVQQINDKNIGIEASINSDTGGIEMVAEDGRNIVVKFNTTDLHSSQLGFREGTYRGKVTIESGTGYINFKEALSASAKTDIGFQTEATLTESDRVWIEGDYKGGGTVDKISISTLSGANDAITVIDNALDMVNQARATSGAYQNRFLAAVTNISTAYTNLAAARSQIMDTDYATESTTLAKSQIVAQAATAMLAQANQSQQSVLALLK